MNQDTLTQQGHRIALERELDATRARLREAKDASARVLASMADGFLLLDGQWRIIDLNASAERAFAPLGKTRESVLGRGYWEEFPELLGTALERVLRRAMAEHVAADLEMHYAPLSSWLHVRAFPSEPGISVFFQDITRRKEAEGALEAEKRLLALVASGADLGVVLEAIAREVESRSNRGMLCSLLLLDEAGERLLHGAAPSLAPEYNAAIHGLRIGPGVGSCGSAAFERTSVYVADIASDSRWAPFRDLAAAHGLAACSSQPIFSSRQEVLGTIAMYYRKPGLPDPADARLIELARNIASIAIEARHSEEARRRSELFSQKIVESSQDCIKTLSLDGTLTWISDAGCRLLLIDDRSAVIGKSWLDFWEGEDRAKAEAAMRSAARGERGSFVGHFPVAGEARWWSVLVSPIHDAAGRTEKLLAVSRDVTDRMLGERQLREREEGLRLLANSIPQLAWMAEPDGHIFWYNERWYAYTGTTHEQMQGWGWQSVHDPAILPRVLERWRASIASGEPFEMEFPLRAADGRMRWFLTRVHPLRDSHGRVTRWFGTNTDIDDVRHIRQALEDETRMLELLNQTGIALASNLDLQQVLQMVTDSATKLSGAKFGAFFYNHVDGNGDVYQLYTLSGAPREAFERFGRPRATALFAPTFRGEGIVRCDDVRKDPRFGREAPHHGMPPGHLPVCSYLAVPVKSPRGEVIGGLFFGHPQSGVFSERTERLVAGIAAQAAVAIDNARLFEAEQRAARDRQNLLESERHARAVAERASRMKDEFLATLSHELRTPLGTILGWAHLLRQKAGPGISEGLEKIERSARAQTRLIEDLLDMSRIDAGKLHLQLEQVDPAAVVEAALETARSAADAKGIAIECAFQAEVGTVRGDASRLQQVVCNILNNAIKFTPHGGHVKVAVRRAGHAAEIRIQDDGEGIEPGFLAHVFERFRQADASTTRRFGGLGLGLSIVKHLVELHGGTVRAESAGKSCGATFIVQLPLQGAARDDARPAEDGAAERADGSSETPAFDLSALRVLVVDDQPDACELVTRVLQESGALVVSAASASDALQHFGRERPDVIVSDIGMPGMDGYELIRKVRAMDLAQACRTPAIAMTAFARAQDRERALAAGFDAHIAKPADPGALVAAVAGLAGRPGACGRS